MTFYRQLETCFAIYIIYVVYTMAIYMYRNNNLH